MPLNLMLCSSLHSDLWVRTGSFIKCNGVEITGSPYPCTHIAIIDGQTGEVRHKASLAPFLFATRADTFKACQQMSLAWDNNVADLAGQLEPAAKQLMDLIDNHFSTEGDILVLVSDIFTDWMRRSKEGGLPARLVRISLPDACGKPKDDEHYIELLACQKGQPGKLLYQKCTTGSISASVSVPTLSELKAEKQAQAEAERQRQIAAETARQLQLAQEQARKAKEERDRVQKELEAKTEETEAAKEAAVEAKRIRILEQLAHKEEQANNTLTQMSKAFPLIRDALSTLERFSTDGTSSAKFSAEIGPIERFVETCRR